MNSEKIGYVPQNVILQDESILKILFGEDEKNIDQEK